MAADRNSERCRSAWSSLRRQTRGNSSVLLAHTDTVSEGTWKCVSDWMKRVWRRVNEQMKPVWGSDGGRLDFSVYNENRSQNISFLHISEFMLLIMRLSSEVKLQAVRLTPLTYRVLLGRAAARFSLPWHCWVDAVHQLLFLSAGFYFFF